MADHRPGPEGPGPLFLLGAPRSGTTLVYKLLCLHPETVWISNWLRRFPAIPRLAGLNRIHSRFPNARDRAWFGADSNAYVFGGQRRLMERLMPSPMEGEPIFRRAGLGEAEITDPGQVPAEVVEKLLKSFAGIQRYAGPGYLVNKRVANNRRIPLLAHAFPSSRFLEIVRDGRAVARSLSHVDWWADSTIWWNGAVPSRWEAEGGDPWELCARSWTEEMAVIRRGLSGVQPDRVMSISYEDFVRRPRDLLNQIQEFAGLSSNESWLDSASGYACGGSDDSWSTELSPEALATIESIQHETLRLLGYPTDLRPGPAPACRPTEGGARVDG